MVAQIDATRENLAGNTTTGIAATYDNIWSLAAGVCDPELPFLTIEDLGILREVKISGDNISVFLTPTYSGCPAVSLIENAVKLALRNGGYEVEIIRVISPAWTTEWITNVGRDKMLAHGIVPPQENIDSKPALFARRSINCPGCKSSDVAMISQFGATACKSLYQCERCMEPFEYFKCI